MIEGEIDDFIKWEVKSESKVQRAREELSKIEFRNGILVDKEQNFEVTLSQSIIFWSESGKIASNILHQHLERNFRESTV